MTAAAIMIACQSGRSIFVDDLVNRGLHSELLEMGLLNALWDAGRPMSVTDLEMQLRCTRRDLLRAITAQYRMGNVRKGQPVELTKSGRFAVTAGAFGALRQAAA